MSTDRTRHISTKEIIVHNYLGKDVFASLVVFLVALPLSIGIALASGAPVSAGIIAAICGGILVGIFGGAPLLVSGPAAGLTVMVFGFIQEFGFQTTCMIGVAAGLLQIVAGLSKTARVALAISPAVIHGMLAGIGILIILSQIQVVMGFSPLGNAWLNIAAIGKKFPDASLATLMMGLLTVVAIVVWQKIPSKNLKLIPAQLVAVALATLVSVVMALDVPRVVFSESIFQAIQIPSLPHDINLVSFIVAAISLNIVASTESLLSAIATDKLHRGPRANLDRELVGQGIANVVSGMMGGLPVTGVIVRSAANIAAGAQSWLSAFLHGIWILLFVTQLSFIIVHVPLAALAGLLIFVGYRLIDPQHIRELKRRGELSIYLATIVGVVGINLLAGIGIGIALAVFRLLRNMSYLNVKVDSSGKEVDVNISGALTFLGVPKVNTALSEIPSGTHVKVDFALDIIDHAGFEAIHDWKTNHKNTGGTVKMESLEDIWNENRHSAARKKSGGLHKTRVFN
ncbi:MAG: SulP family inorganic anion transporter [Bdellovibrionota bacterium]